MTYFIYGVLGMLFTIGLFAAGVFVGWRQHIHYLEKTDVVVKHELSEQEKRRQKEDAQAFDQLVNYSPDLAYGLTRADDVYDTNKG